MQIDVSLTIQSLPSSGWASILHVGESGGYAMPGIKIHQNSDDEQSGTKVGFRIEFSTTTNINKHVNPTPALSPEDTYDLSIQVTQSSLYVYMDGVLYHQDDEYDSHSTPNNQAVYVSSPDKSAADVTIHSIAIYKSISFCFYLFIHYYYYTFCVFDFVCIFFFRFEIC